MDPSPVIDLVKMESEESISKNSIVVVDPSPDLLVPGNPVSLARRKSEVWKHFTLEYRQQLNGKIEPTAICKYCKRCYGAKSQHGTTNLRKHMQKCARPLYLKENNDNTNRNRTSEALNHFAIPLACRKSEIWEHFTLEYRQKPSGNMEPTAICKYCKRCYGGKSQNGTTNLRKHLAKCVHVPKRPGQKTLCEMNFMVSTV